jgi:hypothetical protein
MKIRSLTAVAALALLGIFDSGATFANTKAEIGRSADQALRRFFSLNPANRALVGKAAGVLIYGHVPSRRALWLLRRVHLCWRKVKVRTSEYVNNLVEQHHRAIKRRCASMAGFKAFANAAIAIAGVELGRRIRKG